MYRKRRWTMRQYSGFGTAEETNQRFHYLLEHGPDRTVDAPSTCPPRWATTPTTPGRKGRSGKVGVAIDSLEDMERLLAGLPLDEVSASMTINSTAAILLLFYELVAEKQGVPADKIGGTIQNDLLKEYIARGTYIYPPRQSMRIITDIFAYCQERIPRWNTISISGYHIREAGSTAVQEIAFTLSNGIAYVQAAIDAGLAVDEFAPRLAFFFNAHNNFFEEVAKFRAARRMWYRIMTERFGATGRAVEAAALPHPDRRVDAHRPAAGEQRRPGHPPGAGRGDGRHPVAAHQQLRRGPRPAHRAGGQDRPADPADHRLRVGRDRRPPIRSAVRTSSSR